VSREIPAEIEKETDTLCIFKDKFPKASIHLLIVPKKHYTDISESDGEVWSQIRETAVELAREKNLKGFRLVINAGSAAAVKHMHVHFLGNVEVAREV
jgi:diadenosine tetraphosphate (Ap4A) HIT family hydrolase